MNPPKTFFRVCNPETRQGLWYNHDGSYTGLIHGWFDFCTNKDLEMEFDPELVGWMSAVEELDQLWKWFSVEDVAKLEEHGWFIHEYTATEWKFYERFQHPVIHQESSVLVAKHPLSTLELPFAT